MSDEPEKLIQDIFIDKCGAKYPIVKGEGKVNSLYGISAFPSVFCIAPDGAVHSLPDEHVPSEAKIEELLKQVSLVPKLPDDPRYVPVRTMWEKRQFEKLAQYLDKALADEKTEAAVREVLQGQRDELQKRADRAVERVATLAQGPDFCASTDKLEALSKQWDGFAAAEKAKAELARFKADALIKKEVAAGRALAKINEQFDPSNPNQARKLRDALEKFAKKHDGTFAAKQAAQQAAKLAG